MTSAKRCGSRRMNSPQNTPTIEHPLSRGEVERDLRDLAGSEAHDEKPSAPCHRTQRDFGVRAADRIVDHVNAIALGERLEAFAQIFGRVVDDLVGPVCLADGKLVGGRRGGDHGGAERLADLDGRQPHASRRAKHQHRLARF